MAQDLPQVEAEMTVLGLSHPQVGALVIDHWRFPPSITSAVARHHNPTPPPTGQRLSLSGLLHIADAMVAKGYVADRREAFDRYLADDGPMFVKRYSAPLELGLDLIRAAGGVAVVAHPWGRVSRDQLPPSLLADLAAASTITDPQALQRKRSIIEAAMARARARRAG